MLGIKIIKSSNFQEIIDDLNYYKNKMDEYAKNNLNLEQQHNNAMLLKQQTITSLEKRVREMNDEKNVLESDSLSMAKNLELLEKKNLELSQKNQTLSREKGNLVRGKNALKKSKEEAELMLKTKTSMIRDLEKSVDSLKKQLSLENDKSQTIENQRKQIQILNEKIKVLDPPMIEEYQNNGLSKQTKSALKRRKFRK